MTELTVVMYHYVRDFKRTRFPKIKGLDVSLFRNQLSYLKKNYDIISIEEIPQLGGRPKSDHRPACLLTFDDGYIDHYTYVLPVLDQLNMKGAFFPVAEATLDKKLLDVNKIHYLLASVEHVGPLVERIDEVVKVSGDVKDFYKKYWIPNRYDPAEVNYVKRMLQTALPTGVRKKLTNELFFKYVSQDEAAFAEELYCSEDQLRVMSRMGMHIGSHSWSHPWLTSLSKDQVEVELKSSIDFLKRVRISDSIFSICYPYGAKNDLVMETAKELGYQIGFTTHPSIANLKEENHLALSRLDTNDFPVVSTF